MNLYVCHLILTDQSVCVTEIILKLRGPKSASEQYRLSDRHFSAKFSANFFVDRGGGSPTVVNLSFLHRSRYFSFM
jgi:hypothetical protein